MYKEFIQLNSKKVFFLMWTIFQRRNTDSQQVQEKMLNIMNHQDVTTTKYRLLSVRVCVCVCVCVCICVYLCVSVC